MPACPAYGTLGRESVAPRGQVYNVRAMIEGRLPLTRTLADDIYDCLACRACESVCPAGVPVGSIMEDVRGLITASRSEPAYLRWIKRCLLGGVVPHPRRLALAVAALSLAGRLLPGSSLLPRIPPRKERRPLAAVWPAEGAKRKRVGLFTGCIAAHLFADVNRATARVLQRNGYEVVVPREQVCCGALHLHNGLSEIARRLARRNVEVFLAAGVETVVVNAAGCGAALTEYGELLADAGRAADFARRVADVTVLLVREGFRPPAGRLPARVAYDAPCHLVHAQRVSREPRALLAGIPGLELVDFRDAERCCGSAGIYNLTRQETSMRILDEKMERIATARPDIIATGNPGCLIQIGQGVRRAGLSAEVVHPVILLERAYAASG